MFRVRTKRAVAAGVAGAFLAFGSEPAPAATTHSLKQVTALTEGQIWDPNIRQMDGAYITFVSDGDVMGPGTAHLGRREVYLWSRDTDSIQQITDTVGGESYSATRLTDDYVSKRPAAIVFLSTGDLDPSVGNADGNPEVYLWRMDTGAIRQITNTTAPVVNASPFASDTGDCILFQSTADLDDNDGSYPNSAATGFENADGSAEIFYLDFHDLDFSQFHVTQISNGPVGTTSDSPSAGGYFFAYECARQTYSSDYDQLGNGATGINVYEHRKQEASRDDMSPGGIPGASSIEPRMTGTGLVAGGPAVIFASDADLKHNGSTGFQIFKRTSQTDALTQLTAAPGGGSRRPVISDGNHTVVFQSTGEVADPLKPSQRGPDGPYNADGNAEIYSLTGRRRLSVITRTTGCNNDQPSIKGNGRGIAFRSDCDLVAGANLLGVQQVFAYYEAHFREDYYSVSDCALADHCCSTANGCYERTLAFARRIPRRLP